MQRSATGVPQGCLILQNGQHWVQAKTEKLRPQVKAKKSPNAAEPFPKFQSQYEGGVLSRAT